MKASIKLDASASAPRLNGMLGVINAPYTAVVELTRPDGSTDNIVVSSTGSEAWEITLNNCVPGNYEAVIRPREAGVFEATRLNFSL